MKHNKYIARPLAVRPAEPFATSEDAWLWYSQCQMARDHGVRFTAGLGDVERPCEPDDIVREVQRLYRRRVLRRAHLTVLGRFGLRQAPPDPWGGDTPGEACLWSEALDRLATPLKQKGILA